MLHEVKENSRYRNTKTRDIYWVVAIATHSETEEELVVYRLWLTWLRPLRLLKEVFYEVFYRIRKKRPVWVRPLSLFKEKFEEINPP